MKKQKMTTAVYWLTRIIVILGLAFAVYFRNSLGIMQCLWTLFLLMVPSFVERKWQIQFPTALEIIVILFIFCSMFLGEVNEWYYKISWWDTMLHTTSGFVIGAIGFSLLQILNNSDRVHMHLSPVFVCLFTFSFAIASGGVWEIFEFAADRMLGLNMQKFQLEPHMLEPLRQAVLQNQMSDENLLKIGNAIAAYGLKDTMVDIIVDSIGAAAFSVLAYLYLLGKSKYIDKFLLRKVKNT